MPQLTKTCACCKETKPLESFHKTKSGRLGVKNYCKLCSKEHAQAYYTQNKEQIKEKVSDWQEDNSEKYKEYQQKYYKQNKPRD